MTSLRRSALLWMTALLAVVGALAFAIAYEMARREAADFLDGQLRQVALNAGEGLAEIAVPTAKLDPEDEFVINIWNAAGESVRKPANGIELPRQVNLGFSSIVADGEEWRVYLASDGRRTVQAAQRMSVRDEMAESAAIQAGVPVLGAIPLAWLVIGWALNRVLGGLSGLAQNIAARATDCRDPISVLGVPMEVLPLVEAMNSLAVRLQEAVVQQQRFVSDAAHELRTPLAALQVQIDNLQATAKAEQAEPMLEIRAGIRRASMLLDQLLRMARLEEPTDDAATEAIDLTELVTQCVANFVYLASSKGVDLGMSRRDSASISGSSSQLRMLFGNLIDNAIRYTPAGGVVDVSVLRVDRSTVVEIADTGCGIAAEHFPRLFDRFFRAAPPNIEGSGLGLAIAGAVAKRHDLRIALENRADSSGVRVRVSTMESDHADLICS